MFKFEQLPTGKARELSEFTQKNWQEHLLLFSQVKNKVLEINPDVYTPLKLKKGEPSPLGLFVETAFQEKPPQELPEGKRTLEFWPEHKRSALLGRVLFADKEGRIYRDIDLKGVGYIKNFAEKSEISIIQPGREHPAGGRWGLIDADIAAFDRQMSEEFLIVGIRTHRVLAIIGLEELIVNGKKLSLAEAKRRGVIDEKFNPVVEVRAFGTKARIEDFAFSKGKTAENNLLIEDAKKIVSQELGRKEILSNEEYAEWFAKTLGENIAIMHKNGWLHGYVTAHNITLDCRIVDLDSIAKLDNEIDREKDMGSGGGSLIGLLNSLSIPVDQYVELFEKSYDACFFSESKRALFRQNRQK